ncbi:MAG: phosphate ABC transporter permease subunit PstC, partial [Candidatus Methanoperedens sp.]|nr:phosphate ABC transporter permease subunit PstC [Candidatus Methanoperedens sp.]
MNEQFQDWLMNIRKLKDIIAGRLILASAIFSGLLVFIIAAVLYSRSISILSAKSLSELFLGITWLPSQGEFGFYQFILGTIYVTALAMVFAIPLGTLSAIYLAEYAHESMRSKILPLIDMLAGIPPVVYGMFGVLIIVPLVADIARVSGKLGIPGLTAGSYSTGFSLLAGSVVLAIMIFPIIISISYEVLRSVPSEVREASLSLGATRWQTIKHAVIRTALPGLAAAVILGFSRAFGETIAVL